MFLRFPSRVLTLTCFCAIVFASPVFVFAQQKTLTVCADPDNLPYSNSQQQGFENRVAQVIAADLNARLVYRWQRMGRGFVREYLNKSVCDVVPGIPSRTSLMLTTLPYYRSTYVFVYRREARLKPASLNDPALRQFKIGVQAVGEELTPPGDALARRGMQNNVVPFYSSGGDETTILNAVLSGRLDTAIVWGPLAGYFSTQHPNELQLIPVTPQMDPAGLPFTFAISMGVRKGNVALRDELDAALIRSASQIRTVLVRYGVPQLALPPRTAAIVAAKPAKAAR